MSQQIILRRVFFCLLACLMSNIAWAAIPGADNPKCYTEHDYLKQVLEFNHRTLVDAYEQVGHHDPKWDDAAKKFLEAMTVRLTDAQGDVMYWVPNPYPSADEAEKLGRAAIAAGCDDPLVMDMFCLVLDNEGKVEEMRPLLRKTVDPMMNSQYPVFRAANCVRRALKNSQAPVLIKKYQPMLNDADLATVKFNDWKGPVDRRIVLGILSSDVEGMPIDQQAKFCQDAKDAGADPWLTDMLSGMYHINAAWKARGGGYANTVTQEGWKGMAKELAAASEDFQAAYKLQPTYPEAATEMITVALGQQDVPGLRLWFDRAVQDQFDYTPAYTSYIYAMYPRWYGSHDKMYAFGKECVATNRYDTCVPRMLMTALRDIQNDDTDAWTFWRSPGVFEQARDVLQHYAQKETDTDFYYSEIAAVAWQLHRFDDARQAMDKIGGKPNWTGMSNFSAIADRTTSCIYALTGKSKDALIKAEADNASGNIDAAISAYGAAKKSVQSGDAGAAWITGRYQELQWQKQFDAGDWVNLIPPDAAMSGWWAKDEGFTCDGKSISGIAKSQQGISAICGDRFGPRWQLHIKMQLLPAADGGEVPKIADVGPIFCWTPPSSCYAFRLRPIGQSAMWIDTEVAPFLVAHLKVSPAPEIDLNVWDGKGDVIVDNRPWMTNRDLWLAANPEGRIGIVGTSPEPGAKFIVTELKIRKLTAEPEHPPEPQKH